MTITNNGKNLNMNKINKCKNNYIAFKNAMNGVISQNSMRSKYLEYNPECSEPLPTLGGRKSRKTKRKQTKRKQTRRKH
jgi:hypothetical protein